MLKSAKGTSGDKTMADTDSKPQRITYTRESILSLRGKIDSEMLNFFHKDLDCILKRPRSPTFQYPLYVGASKKKENSESENISLRPQSGSFSSGCAPTSSHGFQRPGWDDSKSDRDRTRDGYRRGWDREDHKSDREKENYRDRSNRFGTYKDQNGRSDRDRDTRKVRDDKEYRLQNRRAYGFNAEFDADDRDKRRRPGRTGNYDNYRESKYGGRNDGEFRGRSDEEEPLWFSEPMTRDDTIELTGGPPELKGYKADDKVQNELNGWGREHDEHDDSETEKSTSRKQSGDSGNNSGFGENIESFLQMDKLPEFFADALPDTSKTTTQSKFAGLFEANTKREKVPQPAEAKPAVPDQQQELMKTMEFTLRSILLGDPQTKTATKPEIPKIPCAKQKMLNIDESRANSSFFSKQQNQAADKAALGELINQMVVRHQAQENLNRTQSHDEPQVERPHSFEGVNLVAQLQSRPSSNGPTDVNQMYMDPLHRLVNTNKEAEKGVRVMPGYTMSAYPSNDIRMQGEINEAQTGHIPQPEQRPVVFPGFGIMRAAGPQQMYLPQQAMQYNTTQNALPPFALNGTHRVHPSMPVFRQQNVPTQSAYPPVGYHPYVPHGGGQIAYTSQQVFAANQDMPAPAPVNPHSQHVPSTNGTVMSPMALFNEQLRSNTQQHPMFTPAQVLSLLPPEVKHGISNVVISPDIIAQPEPMRFLNSIKEGVVSLNDLLQKVNNPNQNLSSRDLHLVYVALKLCLQGALPVRGLVIPGPSGSTRPSHGAPNSALTEHQHSSSSSYRQYQSRPQRSQNDHTASSRGGSSQLQFTPTAVMSYMSTHEQQSRSSGLSHRPLENQAHK